MGKSKKQESGNRSRSQNPLVKHRKGLLIGAGALLVAAGGYQLFNLQQLNKELQIEQAAQVWNVSLTGITIRIDVILKNPTPGQIRVKTPNLTLKYNGELLATSDQVSGENHQVPPFGSVQLDPIMVTLKFLTLALKARSFWQQYQNGGRATISIRALTYVNDKFPVEQTTSFDLGATGTQQAAPVVTKTPSQPPAARQVAPAPAPARLALPAAPTPTYAPAQPQAMRLMAAPLPAPRPTAPAKRAGTAKRPAALRNVAPQPSATIRNAAPRPAAPKRPAAPRSGALRPPAARPGTPRPAALRNVAPQQSATIRKTAAAAKPAAKRPATKPRIAIPDHVGVQRRRPQK